MTFTDDRAGRRLTSAQWIYAGQLADVGAARDAVTDHLAGVPGVDLDDVRLVVGELVANAVVHARSSFTVRVEPALRHVRIEVSDLSGELPQVRPAEPLGFSGRGMHLVHRLAARWGARPTTFGKVVWAELPVD